MKEKYDILSSEEIKENPFRMPEGYLDQLQASVMARIEEENAEPERRTIFFRVLRPAISLAAMFLLIFGMGYGAIALTNHISNGASDVKFSTGIAAIDEGFIDSSFIDYYDDDMALFEEEEELSDEEIIQYLASELTYGQLAQLYDTYNIQ